MTNKTRQYKYHRISVLMIVSMFLWIDFSAYAQGDLLIFPKRLVFEGRTQVEKVTLSNTGHHRAVYSVSFIEYRMTESGDFVRLEEPDEGQMFASPYLKVYPRRVELEPGESQTVKVQLSRPEAMADGEYRSHLYFRAEKNETPRGLESSDDMTQGISVKLEAVFGISIATIVRRGDCQAEASISDVVYTKDEDANHIVSFTINRVGNASLYGDIVVNHINSKGKVHNVSSIRGVGVYTPGEKREVKMLLKKSVGVDYGEGRLEVILKENEKKTVLAQADVLL